MHEGGYTLERDRHGALYFKRPDGRAVPRLGYRRDYFVDDDTDEGSNICTGAESSAEDSAHALRPKPPRMPATIREVPAVYGSGSETPIHLAYDFAHPRYGPGAGHRIQ